MDKTSIFGDEATSKYYEMFHTNVQKATTIGELIEILKKIPSNIKLGDRQEGIVVDWFNLGFEDENISFPDTYYSEMFDLKGENNATI